ncbi:MAG: putative DNA binding domain-containing protein [Thermoguttaceae bacterium]|nr:putative DNA binding domain-containing protein [Thermoguttaceae bacterium]
MSVTIPSAESETVEFKSSFNQGVIESLTAFANSHGGKVFVGISDKREVVGVTLGTESIPNWLNEIRTKTSPSLIPDVEIVEVNDRTVVVFSQSEFPIKPVSVSGRYFVRHAASNFVLSISDVVLMHLKTFNASWDYYIDSVHDLNSISIDKVNEAISAIQKRNQTQIAEAPLDFLRKMELLRDDKVTNAAFLLFSANDTSQTTIELGRFQTPTIIKDSLRTKSDIISQPNQVMDFVKKHINKEIVITGNAENEERWQYPLDAIREIVMNMIVHRDYRSAADSVIKIYNDRIEFYNPGDLPDGLTIDKLLSNNYISAPRNKKIADFFKEMGMIEKYGSGIRRIITPFKERGSRLPVFESVQGGWRVTVYASDKLEYVDQTSDKTGLTSDNSNEAIDKPSKAIDKPPKTSDKPISTSDKSEQTSDKILAFIRERESVSTAEVAMELSLSPSRCRAILASMVNQSILIAVGNNKNRRYKIHP